MDEKTKDKMKMFRTDCRLYLASLGISDLRAYGRAVGVSRPTAKKKEELIEDVVDILSGNLQPISISRQGAPVKNDRVDERILQHIAELQAEYFPKPEKQEIPKFDYQKELAAMRKRTTTLMFASPEEEERGFLSKIVSIGQVAKIGEEYRLLPIHLTEPDKPTHIPIELIQKECLQEGDILTCQNREKQAYATVAKILTINGMPRNAVGKTIPFEDCLVDTPRTRIRLYDKEKYHSVSHKFVEWLMPLAKGHRGCIIAPPKAGKTYLLLQLAEAAKALNPEIEVLALLVDQSPESIGQFRAVIGHEQLYFTTYEDDVEQQVQMADLLLQRIKRMLENKKEVLLIVDSLNSLAHAFNQTEASAGGKTLAGGLEMKTVRYIKKYFGTARCLRQGGSLTLLGSVSAGTGNPVDDILCAELSAQANYEIRLCEELSRRRVYPALDFLATHARQSDMLQSQQEIEVDAMLRNVTLPKIGAERLLSLLEESDSYEEFLQKAKKI